MSGDRIVQHGSGNIGVARHSGPGNITTNAGGTSETAVTAMDRLLTEVEALRQHLDESSQAEMDAAVAEINSNPSQERLSKLLRKIAGIAVLIGEVGTPVITAVKALMGAV